MLKFRLTHTFSACFLLNTTETNLIIRAGAHPELSFSVYLLATIQHLCKTMAKKSFQELISSPGMPVLVDFYADWCGPCKTMAPILQQVAQQYAGKLKVIKIDVDKNPAVAQQYRIQGIPTLLLFHQGKQLWRQSGVVPAHMLSQVVQQHLR